MTSLSINSHTKNNHGFTLIEVLIAIFILTFISMGIYQAITNTFSIREVLSKHGDFYNSIRLSISILNQDISSIYSPIFVGPPKKSDPKDAMDLRAIISGDVVRDAKFWSNVIDKTGLRSTRLIGKENEISFIASSHSRIYRESKECELAKIIYQIQETEKGEKVLVKRESQDVFKLQDEDDDEFKTYPLLYGIKSFSIRYYWKEKKQWYKSWDTHASDTKDFFPDIIEIQLEVDAGDRLKFTGVYKLRPEIPLNGLYASY